MRMTPLASAAALLALLLPAAGSASVVLRPVSLETLLADADYVVLAAELLPRTVRAGLPGGPAGFATTVERFRVLEVLHRKPDRGGKGLPTLPGLLQVFSARLDLEVGHFLIARRGGPAGPSPIFELRGYAPSRPIRRAGPPSRLILFLTLDAQRKVFRFTCDGGLEQEAERPRIEKLVRARRR